MFKRNAAKMQSSQSDRSQSDRSQSDRSRSDRSLCDQLGNQLATELGQLFVAAGVEIGQLVVIQS